MTNFNLQIDTTGSKYWDNPVYSIDFNGGILNLINVDGNEWTVTDYCRGCSGMDAIIQDGFKNIDDALLWLQNSNFKPMNKDLI